VEAVIRGCRKGVATPPEGGVSSASHTRRVRHLQHPHDIQHSRPARARLRAGWGSNREGNA
jgi:hypothetical protein